MRLSSIEAGMQLKVLIARFPFGSIDHKDTTQWLTATILKAKADPRISEIATKPYDDYPIPMVRNLCVKEAKASGFDAVVMIDNDMAPDDEPDGKPFWDTTLDFVFEHREPCIIGAPYCGPPPLSNMYVFRWANWSNPGMVDKDFRLEQYGREEAAMLTGMHPVGALPTGLVWIDMRVFDILTPPYFYYEHDAEQTKKHSTEDVTFTRDAVLQGIPIYCNFDAWAGHWKRFKVQKPRPITVEEIRENYRNAMKLELHHNERMMEVRSNGIEDRMRPTSAETKEYLDLALGKEK
jgi:hypothetical protein